MSRLHRLWLLRLCLLGLAAAPSWASSLALAEAWIWTGRQADVAYFVLTAPPRVERFDLAADAWLPEIPLAGTPLGAALDADGASDELDFARFDPVAGPDGDHDGVADADDAFPADPLEAFDSDGDGVGDRADAFPGDPSEHADSDGDGVGDVADAFPDDPSEQSDFDGDGTGDNADAFVDDPFEQADSDGDGTGDNDDAFPLDPAEWRDSDEDGIGNLSDPTPFGAVAAEYVVDLKIKIKLRRFRPARGRGVVRLTRFGVDGFALCLVDAADCFTGRELSRSKNGRKLVIEFDELSWRYWSRDLDRFLTESIGSGPTSILYQPERGKAKITLNLAKNGRATFKLRVPHRATSHAWGKIDGFTIYQGKGILVPSP